MDDNLSTLQSLFPTRTRDELSRYLSASSNDLARAFSAIERNALARPTKRARTTGPGGLDNWLGKSGKDGQEVEEISLVSSDEEKDVKPTFVPSTASTNSARPQKALLDAYSLLKPSVQSPFPTSTATASPNPAPNLPPLRLTTSAMIAHHTNGLITLVENVLPTELAGRLYVKMVEESEGKGTGEYAGKPWEPNKWFLVDREVTSPHTSAFYRESASSISQARGYDNKAFDEVSSQLPPLSPFLLWLP
jgi:hypothetical protein